MNVMTLFRKNPSQSLIQAPSADLIVADTGPRLPEPIEITCQMTTEEFEAYMSSIHYTKNRNITIDTEGLRQCLKVLGCKRYPNKKVSEFLNVQAMNLRKTISVKSYEIPRLREYNYYGSYLPPRIINLTQEINSHRYSPKNIYFWISDFYSTDLGFRNNGRRNTEICFLAVSSKELSNSQKISYLNNALIIDAWRGPTFSDEEAKI